MNCSSSLGDQGHGEHYQHIAGSERRQSARDLCFLSDALHGIYVSLGGLWACCGRIVSIRAEDAIVIGVAWYGVHARAVCSNCWPRLPRNARRWARSERYYSDAARFFARLDGRSAVDVTGDHLCGASGVQWWAFWYPEQSLERGYIAQRIFSAKDERNGLLSCCGSTWRIMR